MKPINNKAANQKNPNLDTGDRHNTGSSDDYNNDINSGEIGAEGSIYNGAAELRQLRKKHNNELHNNEKR